MKLQRLSIFSIFLTLFLYINVVPIRDVPSNYVLADRTEPKSKDDVAAHG
ncbi:hypothetical protein [Paenibacillus sinopodophylli]|nr:hypothetical protein [Paenibacillus sinopodophylli]